MNISAHISIEELVAIAEDGTTLAEEPARVHLATCSACVEELTRLKQLIVMMEGDTTKDAPRDVLAGALNIFSREKTSTVQRLVAILTFDSRTAAPEFGMRSLHTASRQLLYSTGETDVELRISALNDECTVAGQVIMDECAEGSVRLEGATGSVATSLNEMCEFTLPAVPFGTYSITVNLPDVEIEILEVELNA